MDRFKTGYIRRKFIKSSSKGDFEISLSSAIEGGWHQIGETLVEENGRYTALVEMDTRTRTRKALLVQK